MGEGGQQLVIRFANAWALCVQQTYIAVCLLAHADVYTFIRTLQDLGQASKSLPLQSDIEELSGENTGQRSGQDRATHVLHEHRTATLVSVMESPSRG